MQRMKDFIVSFLEVHKLCIIKEYISFKTQIFLNCLIINQAPHFQATISRESYQLLRKFCRFDDTETRNEIKNDKFALIGKL